MSEEIKKLNKQLKEKFGFLMDGRPLFRLVWSTDQLEYRRGEFNDFIKGTDVLLRRFKGVREVQKYPFKQDRWVLERLIFQVNREIESAENGSYEPIFIFEDNAGFYLEPVWRAIEIMCFMLIYGTPLPRKSEEGYDEEERKDFEREVNFMEDYLRDKRDNFQTMKEYGEAISMAGVKPMGEKS